MYTQQNKNTFPPTSSHLSPDCSPTLLSVSWILLLTCCLGALTGRLQLSSVQRSTRPSPCPPLRGFVSVMCLLSPRPCACLRPFATTKRNCQTRLLRRCLLSSKYLTTGYPAHGSENELLLYPSHEKGLHALQRHAIRHTYVHRPHEYSNTRIHKTQAHKWVPDVRHCLGWLVDVTVRSSYTTSAWMSE